MQVYHENQNLAVICSSEDGNAGHEGENETGLAEKTRPKLQTPRKYKVLLHNDDYTTMEFVIHILKKFFNKTSVDAQQVMMHVHTRGVGVCGVFTHEVAESKVAQVTKYARKNGHPLRCSSEPCDS